MVLNVLEPNGTAVITLAPARPTSNAQFRAFKAAARVRIPLGTQDNRLLYNLAKLPSKTSDALGHHWLECLFQIVKGTVSA
jgi:hypothetical protein